MPNFFKNIIAIYALLCIIHFAAPQSFADDFENEIDKLFSLPEANSVVFKGKGIDIGIAALTLAKEIYPNLDIKAYSAKIDKMVIQARILTKGSTDPDYRIRALNTYLYKMEGIKYDLSDPNAEKLENRYLNGILDTKKGSCVTMPLLYLSIAQRLGYPVYPVTAPQHLFLRYIDPNLQEQNIDPAGEGGYVSDDEYIYVLQISPRALKNGAYLRTLTYRELLADLVAQNAIYWAKRGKYKRAIQYLKKCIKVDPKSADTYNTIGKVYLNYSRVLEKEFQEELAQEYRFKAASYLQKAEKFGVSKLPHGNYIEEQRKAQETYREKQAQKGGAK
ncbi:MAG: tetratricopeptide repeat protein [Deltaproteobacteria bacterium]|nr:tetratricopeptide repeat protein [Deltaproteobacteria bacterium]